MAKVIESFPSDPCTPSNLSLRARIYGCWLGKSIGGTLGLPAEGRVGPLNFEYYNPVPKSAPPNDDLELQIVWLHLLEQKGLRLTQTDMAQGWLDHIHYMWDEYGRCRWNLRRGVPAAAAGTFENWFVSGMGSPIRSEIWACLAAGNTEVASGYARLDASLDHGLEGIEGEVFLAVMQTLLLQGAPLPAAIDQALVSLDPSSETTQAIRIVVHNHGANLPVWDAYAHLVSAHGHDNFTHAPLNLGLTIWALLYGEGDFERSVLLAVNGGYDTDCTAATVGASLGIILGAKGIPERWKNPIGDRIFIGPGIIGVDAPVDLDALTDRVCQLAATSRAAPFIASCTPPPPVDLASLPGTITLNPLTGTTAEIWANGEIPSVVHAAGGAEWNWSVGEEVRNGCLLVALARTGAKLYIDDSLFITCPEGLPYVPALHRCPPESCREFIPKNPIHRMRLELKADPHGKDASVFLGTPARHLAPWNATSLPYRPLLAP